MASTQAPSIGGTGQRVVLPETARIDSRREGAVGYITLNRPSKLNAFTGTMREEILAALCALEAESGVRVIVIAGAGRGFCGGGDVAYMKELRDSGNVADFCRILDAANAVARQLYGCSKVTIAAVQGPAAGGGANLALACDLRVGTPACSFTQSFVKIGLGPDWGGSHILPRIVGVDRARELLLTGRSVGADEAKALGLLHQLVPAEELEKAVSSLAERLARASPHAVAAIKGGLRQPPSSLETALEYERSAQLRCFLTREAYESFARFAERRSQ